MPNIEPRRNKSGRITSYKIVVSSGYDSSGKKLRHQMTWKPDPNKTARQNEKALHKAAMAFEQSIEQGYSLDNRQTFEQYAQYVVELKKRSGCKVRTLDRYQELLWRINQAIGHMKLGDIRPQHLNSFYKNLAENGIRKGGRRATTKPILLELKKERELSIANIAAASSVAASTVSSMLRGKAVQESKAAAVSAALGQPLKILFTLEQDNAPLSSKTILEHHRLISVILAQAEKEMLVPYNAASKATPPRVKKKTPNYFQPEEIAKILTALETEPLKWRTLVTLMISTGCRRGRLRD